MSVSIQPAKNWAVITGASRGIGAAIARVLAPRYRLVLVARSHASLEALARELSTDTVAMSADLSDSNQTTQLVDNILEHTCDSTVAALINNAGLAHSAPLSRTTDADFHRLMAVNLTAPFLLCRGLLDALCRSGEGRIVNISSTAALKGYRYTSAYSASKAGLVGFSRALAIEVATKCVTVNAVCPGFTDTDIAGDAIANISRATGRSTDKARASLEQFSPQGRLRTPEEIAALVAYLCSPEASGITGQALAIDGGETG